MRKKRLLADWLVYALLTLAALFTLFPLLMALMNSFKTNGQLLTDVVGLPQGLHVENYVRTWNKMHYLRSLGNTAYLAAISVTLIVLLSALAGWRLCRTKTKLSGFLFSLFVFSMLIPFSSIMIPLYRVVLAFKLKNSLLGLCFIYAGLGVSMAIFLYHGFVKGIPLELEEAAAIDGCNLRQTFISIVMPMLTPVTATVVITNVLWIWNDFLLPLVVLSKNDRYTLLLSTNTLFGQYASDWTAILSALMLAAVPVIVFYALFQKRILDGIADGAVKG
jgi:raffinose/stachyose/melibiose transport system permease protein